MRKPGCSDIFLMVASGEQAAKVKEHGQGEIRAQ
jgi:hypothetical protein